MFSFRLVPEQPKYKCFENDPDPVDINEQFENFCLDYHGNIHHGNATLTSCCECIRLEQQIEVIIKRTEVD